VNAFRVHRTEIVASQPTNSFLIVDEVESIVVEALNTVTAKEKDGLKARLKLSLG